MHIISKRAAVAVDSEANVSSNESTFPGNPPTSTAIKTLWASKSLPTHAGRVVAVRIHSSVVEVGIIDNGNEHTSMEACRHSLERRARGKMDPRGEIHVALSIENTAKIGCVVARGESTRR